RVILISLDGAAAADLEHYYRQGEFDELRGFRRFFEEGQVAEGLIPVDPTLTSPNHASLATGAPPARTGIVGNTFHRPGDPVGKTVSGFDLPLETEALWETARRQGKRAVSITWPHAHGPGSGGGRRADRGVLYVNDPEADARLVELARSDWGEPDRAYWRATDSPLRMARVAIEGRDGARVAVKLYAADGRDDGAVRYDTIEVWPEVEDVRPDVLEPGGLWAQVELDPHPRGEDQGPAVSYAKLLELAPDLARARIYFGGAFRTRAFPPPYLEAVRGGGLSWPGAPDDDLLEAFWAGKPGIDLPTWLEQAQNLADFYGQLLVGLPGSDDWDLALVYLPHIDEAGHQLYLASPRQPGWSRERMVEFENARRAVWRMADRVLAQLFATGEAMADTAVVVVSDHGMHPLHSMLDPNFLLRREGLQQADAEGRVVAAGTSAWAATSSAMAHVYLTAPAEERAPLTERLRRLFADFEVEGERPVARVVTRKEAGAMGLDHPAAGDLLLFAAPGWLMDRAGARRGAATGPADHLGAHGYLSSEPRMRAIYLALGPGVERGRIGPVRTTEVAGRVAALLGIGPPHPLPSMPQPPAEPP
ncbi:MAG TPA: alkaline phosphatase family protein, partial [Thermoanaerobaculia bacterium]|nr:alkaline phosphatase family protein [Thermoanaerobaculia bacterium]